MKFLPSIPLPDFFGQVAINVDGTLVASIDSEKHCVSVCSVNSAGHRIAGPIIYGTVDIPGKLAHPNDACFVRRNGIDTLLICDWGNNRVVEVSTEGALLGIIFMHNPPIYIKYCSKRDVIAVTSTVKHTVSVLQYRSGRWEPLSVLSTEVGLVYPGGVEFTQDGACIIVADCGNNRLVQFNTDTGRLVKHLTGVSCPKAILLCEDGCLMVASETRTYGSVMFFGVDGIPEAEELVLRSVAGDMLNPISLSYSPLFQGVVANCSNGAVVLLRDAWAHSSRYAWLAVTCFG